MIAKGEAELCCDFMETYRIPDYRALPARQAALFAYGLGEGSRIRRKLSGAPVGLDTMLLAMIADGVNLLVWQNTQAGHEGRNRPPSVLAVLRGKQEGEGSGFDSVEEFNVWRASMMEVE